MPFGLAIAKVISWFFYLMTIFLFVAFVITHSVTGLVEAAVCYVFYWIISRAVKLRLP
jgi:hypothetical protein